MKLTKSKLKEIIREELLNEATYIKGKADNILRHAERSVIQPLVQNISESPDALDANPKSAKNAMKQISKAWADFKRAVEKANKPVEKNYTGV